MPGYSTRSTALCLFEERGDRGGVLLVAVHAHGEGLDAAQDEIAVERRRHRAGGVLEERQLLCESVVAGDHDARRPRRSGRPGTWCSSARRRRRPARVVVAGTAWRRCCRRRLRRPAGGRSRPPPRCRRPRGRDWWATRSTPCRSRPGSSRRVARSMAATVSDVCTRVNNRYVPPYASVGMTTWPLAGSVRATGVLGGHAAGEGERRGVPPSRSAMHASSTARVGLPVRAYSKPRCSPTPSWANVVARWIGGTTAPVAGIGILRRRGSAASRCGRVM